MIMSPLFIERDKVENFIGKTFLVFCYFLYEKKPTTLYHLNTPLVARKPSSIGAARELCSQKFNFFDLWSIRLELFLKLFLFDLSELAHSGAFPISLRANDLLQEGLISGVPLLVLGPYCIVPDVISTPARHREIPYEILL